MGGLAAAAPSRPATCRLTVHTGSRIALNMVVRTARQDRGTKHRDAGIPGSKGKTKLGLLRLINGMKSSRAPATMIIGVLGLGLMMNAMGCPLWMSSLNEGHMPCSEHRNPPEPCPLAICQAGSPYLASHVSTKVPLLVELAEEAVDWTIVWTQPENANPIQGDDRSPPGPPIPLFLQTHSFDLAPFPCDVCSGIVAFGAVPGSSMELELGKGEMS